MYIRIANKRSIRIEYLLGRQRIALAHAEPDTPIHANKCVHFIIHKTNRKTIAIQISERTLSYTCVHTNIIRLLPNTY